MLARGGVTLRRLLGPNPLVPVAAPRAANAWTGNTRAAAAAPIASTRRHLHIYKCTFEEQKAGFKQGLAPPEADGEPFVVSPAAAALPPDGPVCYVLNHDRGIDESEHSYRQRSLSQLHSHVFATPGMIYKLIDSAEFAMENKLMYFGHVAAFVLDDRNNTLFTASFRRDPRKPLPKAQAANMQGAILPQGVAADMPEGAPLHYRQLFMALLTTAEEELGRFLLATAVPGSERCCKNFGLFVAHGQRLDGEQISKFVSHCEAGNKAKDRVYGPLNGHYESFSLSEAQTELRALSAAERVDFTLDNVFSLSSDDAFRKGVGLLAFGDAFRSHAAAALLECLNWPQDSGGPSAQRAAACRAVLGRIYSHWGHTEQAQEYGADAEGWRSVASRAECCSLTLEDLELVKQFTPRELGWWP